MGLNTYPYSPFPASTEQLHKGDNEQIQAEIDQLKSGLTNVENELNGDATVYPYADVITIEDAVPANLADCSVKIEPVQSGSGDPSPTNVRPITGHTETSVVVTDGDETTKTYTIALGDTIYGGTVGFDSGVMTVTHCFHTLKGTENFSLTEGSETAPRRFSRTLTNLGWDTVKAGVLAISNMFLSSSTLSPTDAFGKFRVTTNVSFTDADSVFANATEFNTWLATQYANDTPVEICYELNTPFTIQLTPKQIQLLKGTNTITASTGDISVTVNGVSGSIGSVQTQANATDAALAELTAEIAEQLPTAPTTDGAYVLTVTVESGTPTYSWESAE